MDRDRRSRRPARGPSPRPRPTGHAAARLADRSSLTASRSLLVRLPVAALQSAGMSLKTREQIAEADAPLWPADPATFDYNGHDVDVYDVPIDGTTRAGTRKRRAGTASDVRGSGEPGRRHDHLAGLVAHPRPAWMFAPALGELREVWDLIDFPRLLFNTIVLAMIGTIGRALLHARGLWLRRFRFPGGGAVHAPARDDLPAGRRDADPDLHDVREARLGRARGCRSWCRRSSRTPTTSSCSASTS